MNGSSLSDISVRRESTASRDNVIVWVLLPLLILVYVGLTLAGHALLVTKTLVLPLMAVYALCTADRIDFLRDWSIYIAATLLFDAVRGLIFSLTQPGFVAVRGDYVVALESLLTGRPALSATLQALWRNPLLDRVFVAWHGSHFLFFLLFGLAVWHSRRNEFWRYRSACLGVMYAGLAGYLLVPTIPPWLAARMGLISDVSAIAHEVYANGISTTLITAFDTNPVAAMPSLHIALPAACAMLAWRLFGRGIGAALIAYTAVQAIGVVYLGEHYVADVLAGLILAGFVIRGVVLSAPPAPLPLPRSMLYAGGLLAATAVAAGAQVLVTAHG